MPRLTRRLSRVAARLAVCAVALGATPAALHAHGGEPLRPHDLPGAWSADPLVLAGLAIAAVLYASGSVRLARRSRRSPRTARPLWFWLGWGTLALALVTPLHALGGVLFSAHMVQHELLITVAAPLLVVARPSARLAWGLPLAVRRAIARLFAAAPVRGTWRLVTGAWVAFLLHAVAIWAWHAPALYERTLTSDLLHGLQHTSFLVTALLFWAAVLPRGRRGRAPAIACLFLTTLHTTGLGALLTFAPSLWYPAYATTTAPWGLMPLDDQAIAGLIMWIPGGVAYVVAALVLLGRMLREQPREPAWTERPAPQPALVPAGEARMPA